jgi:hypothetical protein
MAMFPTDQYCPSVWLNNTLFQMGIRRGKHVVEMHEFAASDSSEAEGASSRSSGFWELVGNHLRGWKRWLRYARMAVIGGRSS